MKKLETIISTLIFCLTFSAVSAAAQTTEFIYQGRLTDNGMPPTANYDFEFRLFAVDTGGTAIATIQRLRVAVSSGNFTVKLDFGANFDGQPRFLETAVKPAGSPNPFTVLSPRQTITSAPYSIQSLNATTADNALNLGGAAANQYVITSDSRLSDARNPLPNSGNYIQNATSQQATSNFNISGNGAAGGTLSGNIVRATTQFNIGIDHALSLGSSSSVFAGRLAGASNTTGSGNSFFGESAGRFNTTGFNNSFFGSTAGTVNTASNNSFFGAFSGSSNTTGTRNSFFGSSAGDANDVGNDNAFFGYRAGRVNTASLNSFFGSSAGDSNTTGTNNAFFGYNAGTGNLTGAGNSFFGSSAGQVNTADSNSFFGYQAGFSNTSGTKNAFFGTGTGGSNVVGSNNAFFGYQAGDSNTSGSQNSFFGFKAGGATTTSSNNSFFGYNAGALTNSLSNSFFGANAGDVNTSGQVNTFIGGSSGGANTTGSFNVFVGGNAGNANTTGSNNTVVGALANVGLNNLTYATAIGAGATVYTSNTVVLGASADKVSIPGRLDVSLTATFGNITTFDSLVKLNNLGGSGTTDLCLNASNNIANCSSSLRYKTNVQTFTGGLEIVRRLRPITFNWKDGGMRDVGFGAEEVEKVEPLLATYNKDGQIEGVKYGQITTVLVNAVKEQQRQIEDQQKQLRDREQQASRQQQQLQQQQQEITVLKQWVCRTHPKAGLCQPAKSTKR